MISRLYHDNTKFRIREIHYYNSLTFNFRILIAPFNGIVGAPPDECDYIVGVVNDAARQKARAGLPIYVRQSFCINDYIFDFF